MLKKFIIILLLAISVIGCEKSESPIEENIYPTTIEKLSSDKLSQLQRKYFQRNPHISSTLNKFGFCQVGHRDVDYPPLTDSISMDDAIEIAKRFILVNNNVTGISNVDDVQFNKKNENSINTLWTSHWYLKTKNQMIDSIEVLRTGVGLRILNAIVTDCSNNWYPDIYIPNTFNFYSEEAKSILVDRVVTHVGWGSSIDVTITEENLGKSEVRLVVYPIEYEDKIELRVAWEVHLPYPVYYNIYVDIMTSEIIAEEPTIIS